MASPGRAADRDQRTDSRLKSLWGVAVLPLLFGGLQLGAFGLALAEPRQQAVIPSPGGTPGVGWAVVAVSGPVVYRVSRSGGWRSLSRAQVLRPGFEVITGYKGFAKLVRAYDQVTIQDNAHLIFPVSAGRRSETRIFQIIGSAFFEVTKRLDWDFEVKTPFLAAVVKGTSFGVSVDKSGASVSVEGGLVGVSAAEGDDSADVAPGQTASVSAGAAGVSVGATAGPAPAAAAAAAAAAAVPSGDVAAADGAQNGSGNGSGAGGDEGGATDGNEGGNGGGSAANDGAGSAGAGGSGSSDGSSGAGSSGGGSSGGGGSGGGGSGGGSGGGGDDGDDGGDDGDD